MAQKQNSKTGGMIRWDASDFITGLVPYFLNTQHNIFPSGMGNTTAVDPYRVIGTLQPGKTPTAMTNSSIIDALQIGIDVDQTVAYSVGGTKIHKLTLSTDTLTTPTTFPYTVSAHGGHTGLVMQDCLIYYVGTTKYLFYSWSDSGGGDIGRYDLATTFDDDYMSTVATGGGEFYTTYPHPMVIGADNVLYIADGKDLAGYDGSDDTFNHSVLDLPSDYIITSFAKTENFLVVYAYRNMAGNAQNRGQATAFFWDYASDSFTYAYDLPGNYVNGGFEYKGTVGCFVYGRYHPTYTDSAPTQLMLFTGGKFESLLTFPDTMPGHNGVETMGNMLYWNSGGIIYSYGELFRGFTTAINKITQATGTTNYGFLKDLGSNKLYCSTGTTTSGGYETFSGGYNSSAWWISSIEGLAIGMNKRIQPTMVKINWGAVTGTNCNTFSFKVYYNNRVSNFQILSNLASITATGLTTTYYYDTSGKKFPIIDSNIQIEGAYGAGSDKTAVPPYPVSVEVYYDYIT